MSTIHDNILLLVQYTISAELLPYKYTRKSNAIIINLILALSKNLLSLLYNFIENRLTAVIKNGRKL